MKELRARFIGSIQRTPTVKSFRFLPEEGFSFQAGQFLQVIFDPQNHSNKDLNKYLSFSSSPGKDYFEITKRLSNSEFSRKLLSLKENDFLSFKLPMGSCVFDPAKKKIAFLVGGIGITPVVSMLEFIVENKLDTDAYLLYSNRSEEEIAFRKELDSWKGISPGLKIVYTVTDCAPLDKTCFFGAIDESFLLKNVCDASERSIYIFGPPRMVDTMLRLAEGLACNKENIHTERFVGY